MKKSFVRNVVAGIAVLVVMIMVSACSGLSNGQNTLTGSVVSVNASTNTVVLSVNGQNDSINHVPADIIQLLQSQVGKVYTVQVTTNSDGSFSIVGGSNVTLDNNQGTPNANETPNTNETATTNEPGSIEFFGKVQSTGANSLVVSMPNGSTLSLATNSTTDLGDFNNVLPGVNTQVKVDATANADGSFTATKIGNVDPTSDNVNEIKFDGVTTAAVGSDHVIHFAVGNKSFSFAIASNADLSDFNNNAQSIQNGASVKVTVDYNGTNGTATNIGLNSGN
ncbi:MAG TPA: DUF5666 domain-containing protein [Ktedonobacteraceae bacterium]|nr:DUF5666 domain-containing protein [Ktedonobacteraceae bacterium]